MYLLKMRVKEIMRNVQTVSPEATVKEAADLMNKRAMGSLVVITDNKKVVGIVTERDILEKVTAKDKLPSKVLIEHIMTPKIISIEPGALLDDAVYLMIKHKIKKLPVVGEKEELLGIITSTDLINNSEDIGQFYMFE